MEIAPYLQAVDAQPDALYVAHQQPENFPVHQHAKGQLTYIEGGVAVLFTEGKSHFIPARHYVWVPAHTGHQFVHRTPATVARTIFVGIKEKFDQPFFRQVGIYPVNQLLLEMLVFTEKWPGNALPGTLAYRFLEVLILLLPEISIHPLPLALPTTQHKRLLPVLRYIHAHIGEVLSLEETGREFGFSGRTLNRLFRSAMDISFFQYVKMARMIKAMELLLQTDKSIREIAYDTGYNSLSAFSNTFFELTNKRPTAFQKHKR